MNPRIASTPSSELRIQVQPEREPALSLSELKVECHRLVGAHNLVTEFRLEKGEDNGPYLNLVFATPKPLEAWLVIREALYKHAAFGTKLHSASIVLCTGQDGWNDYLLLYHYDPAVPLNSASET